MYSRHGIGAKFHILTGPSGKRLAGTITACPSPETNILVAPCSVEPGQRLLYTGDRQGSRENRCLVARRTESLAELPSYAQSFRLQGKVARPMLTHTRLHRALKRDAAFRRCARNQKRTRHCCDYEQRNTTKDNPQVARHIFISQVTAGRGTTASRIGFTIRVRIRRVTTAKIPETQLNASGSRMDCRGARSARV
jgi:hypothetical protein